MLSLEYLRLHLRAVIGMYEGKISMSSVPEAMLTATCMTLAKLHRGIFTVGLGQVAASPNEILSFVEALAERPVISIRAAAQDIMSADSLPTSELETCIAASRYNRPSWHVHPAIFWPALGEAYMQAKEDLRSSSMRSKAWTIVCSHSYYFLRRPRRHCQLAW